MKKNNPNEIYMTRIYNAPIKIVWDAWTDPAQVSKWWGPRGFSLTTHSKDLKPGGHWHYTMHGPDGKDYINKTKYFEVEKQTKLVYDHGGNDEQAPLFRVTVLFHELSKDKTEMEMTMALATAEAAQETKKFIKKAGGESTWDRLAEYLGKEISNKEIFVINRTFEAPMELLFEVWTNPQHFSQWLAPTGFKMKFIHSDIRTGGKIFYMMTNGTVKMYAHAHYLEVKHPNEIIYTQEFCDEKENISRHPMAPTWPQTMHTHVLLTEEDSQKTRVTITWEVHGKATAEEMETFIKSRGGMTLGWSGSFEKLDQYLLQLSEKDE